MILIVDFRTMDDDGQVTAQIDSDQVAVLNGEMVIAADVEGAQCWALVVETVATPRGAYAVLLPIGGTRHPVLVNAS